MILDYFQLGGSSNLPLLELIYIPYEVLHHLFTESTPGSESVAFNTYCINAASYKYCLKPMYSNGSSLHGFLWTCYLWNSQPEEYWNTVVKPHPRHRLWENIISLQHCLWSTPQAKIQCIKLLTNTTAHTSGSQGKCVNSRQYLPENNNQRFTYKLWFQSSEIVFFWVSISGSFKSEMKNIPARGIHQIFY